MANILIYCPQSHTLVPALPSLEVQRPFPYVTAALIHCVLISCLFCHFVNIDAVMASSGHQSSVTSLEVVPSVAGGQELEAPLLASEEGMEWRKSDLHNMRDPVYHFINVPYDFGVLVVGFMFHRYCLSSSRVIRIVIPAGLSGWNWGFEFLGRLSNSVLICTHSVLFCFPRIRGL